MSSKTLRLLLGLIALATLIGWVWRTQHRHSEPLPAQLQAGKHGNRHLSTSH